MRDPKLIQLGVATAVAAATAVAIMVIPMYWRHSEPPAQPGAFTPHYDDLALQPPSAPPFEHIVKTEKYVALTTAPKTWEPKSPETRKPESQLLNGTEPYIAPDPSRNSAADRSSADRSADRERDICQRDGGWRVTTRHGWRCRYPRHRR